MLDSTARGILQLFGEFGQEVLDLHTLFEAGGNDPARREAVLDEVFTSRHVPGDTQDVGFAADLAVFYITLLASCAGVDGGFSAGWSWRARWGS